MVKKISSHKEQMNVISLQSITKSNIPFFVGITTMIIWLQCFASTMGLFSMDQKIFTLTASNLFIFIYLLSTCLTVVLFDAKYYVAYAKYSGIIVLLAFATAYILNNVIVTHVTMIIAAVGVGHIFASTGYGFTMVLNNAEKFFSILIGLAVSKLLQLMKNFFDVEATFYNFKILSALLIILIVVCAFQYSKKAEHMNRFVKNTRVPMGAYSILLLVFIVFALNEMVAPALLRGISNDASYAMVSSHFMMGALIGVVLMLFLQRVLRLSISYVINFSLVLLLFAFVISIIAYSMEYWVFLSAFFFGCSYAVGFVNIYYVTGIMTKKFRNRTFFRIGIAASSAFYIVGYILAQMMERINSQAVFIFLEILSILGILIVFLLSPLFTKMLYALEWTDDIYRLDVTRESRLVTRLTELKFSPKEIAVCELLLQGYTMRQICAMLSIAYPTVNTYCTSIYRKLNINSRTELIILFKDYMR